LAARDIENLGDHVDVSVQEAVAFATGGYGTAPFEYQNEMVRRSNLTNTVITRDGLYVVAQMLNITDEKWLSFKDWIVGQGVAGELTELPPAEFESNRSAVLQAVERVAKLWDADELCRLGQGFGFTWMKLNSVRDLFTDPQLRSRGFFREMEHRELGTAFEYGGPGAEWSEAGWSLRRRPPLLGEDNADYGVDA
jgi:crotonobetainyl-CoA:carnitine CoA-transferase CaiB-like acyl-CoA transferase